MLQVNRPRLALLAMLVMWPNNSFLVNFLINLQLLIYYLVVVTSLTKKRLLSKYYFASVGLSFCQT